MARKVKEKINSIFIFLPIFFLYFVGLGLSKLLYIIFSKNNEEDGWQKPKKLRKSMKFYEEML